MFMLASPIVVRRSGVAHSLYVRGYFSAGKKIQDFPKTLPMF
jgi:hypothetical protein